MTRTLLVVIAATALYAFVPAVRAYGATIYERIAYALDPSAERAMHYGTNHFDALESASYDIDLAERYFTDALRRDADVLFARHQLGRIAFLRGDFHTAITLLDEELARNSDLAPSSYYVRALILGYMGRYEEAAADYEHFLKTNPASWAALNDYAWVLLKAGRAEEAAKAARTGLDIHPENPWLLNTAAIALYELGSFPEAHAYAIRAQKALSSIEERDWLAAYPGNDPRTAQAGIRALQDSIAGNMHTIEIALDSGGYNETDGIDAL